MDEAIWETTYLKEISMYMYVPMCLGVYLNTSTH